MAERKWYALYTKSRTEKRVEEELVSKDIDTYLPLEKTLRQWSDRKKWVEVPLFRSYIFVYTETKTLQRALNTKGVVTVVRFDGQPATIPDSHIDAIKQIIGSGEAYETSVEDFAQGEQVQINYGKLRGMKGELIQKMNRTKVLIRIEGIQQNMLVHIHPSNIERV